MKKRKGASSVLVLFMVIVLVTIGLFTIVAASINYDLSKKYTSWNTNFYELDKVCEDNLGEVDKYLLESEQAAVQLTLDKYSNNDDSFDVLEVYDFMNSKYKEFVIENLNNLENTNDYSQLYVEYDENNIIKHLGYSMDIKSKDDENYGIQVSLEVRDILYDISYENGVIKGSRNSLVDRFDIKQWKQYQDIDEVEPEIEIWDPREDLDIE